MLKVLDRFFDILIMGCMHTCSSGAFGLWRWCVNVPTEGFLQEDEQA